MKNIDQYDQLNAILNSYSNEYYVLRNNEPTCSYRDKTYFQLSPKGLIDCKSSFSFIEADIILNCTFFGCYKQFISLTIM